MDKNKSMCRGCRDDFYNQTEDGGCWCFQNAAVVTRIRVGVWEDPPYHPDRAAEYLSCFRKQGSALLMTTDSRVRDKPFPENV